MVISAIVLYFIKYSPLGGKSGTVMVGVISGQDIEQGKTSTSKNAAKPKSTSEEISEPKVALQKKPAIESVKKNNKNVIQKETVKTAKKETKSANESEQDPTSEALKKDNSKKGTETASAGQEGKPTKIQTQASTNAGSNHALAYPDYNFNPKPKYPRTARKRGYEGEVKLKVLVLENGRVGKIEVVRPSGYQILDQSALEAVKNWIFVPGKENGKEVSSWVTVPITFQLKSG